VTRVLEGAHAHEVRTNQLFGLEVRVRSFSQFPVCRLCGQVEYQSDATSVVSNQMRKCDRKRITGGSLRNVPALVKRPNGIEGVLGPDVHLAFADCGSCVDVRVEFIDRQNFPIASSTQHDDLAVDADG
jgi:hypothetical protein